MSHSYVRVIIHFGWSTKYFRRVFSLQQREAVRQHMLSYALENEIVCNRLAVQPEHIHLLCFLGRSQRIEDIPKLLKGESAHWINDTGLIGTRFSWKVGYFAESVSPSDLYAVQRYIDNQDEHHKRKSFTEEYTAWLASQGYELDETGRVVEARNR